MTRKNLHDDVEGLSTQIRWFHMQEINGAIISTTLDHWTPTNTHDNYVAMTASWITGDWENKSCVMYTGNGSSQRYIKS